MKSKLSAKSLSLLKKIMCANHKTVKTQGELLFRIAKIDLLSRRLVNQLAHEHYPDMTASEDERID